MQRPGWRQGLRLVSWTPSLSTCLSPCRSRPLLAVEVLCVSHLRAVCRRAGRWPRALSGRWGDQRSGDERASETFLDTPDPPFPEADEPQLGRALAKPVVT